MGRDTLECRHDWKQIWEDDILMGYIYVYDECKKCRSTRNIGPGPLDLGTYK